MAEGDTFGSGLDPSAASFGQGPSPMMGGDAGPDAPSGAGGPGPSQPSMFGSGFGQPRYTAPDPQATALDQSADLLQQVGGLIQRRRLRVRSGVTRLAKARSEHARLRRSGAAGT